MAALTVAIVEGGEAEREFEVDRSVLVGRDPLSDVVINDPEVSGKHASLAPSGGGVQIEDLGTSNGTFVNGERVSAARQLRVGDRIQLGATVLEIRGAAPAVADAPAGPADRRVTRTRLIPTMPVLIFVSGQLARTERSVGGPLLVGRDPDVAGLLLDEDPEVSRRHAMFSPAGVGLTVQDLGSTNGTFVNERQITGVVTLSSGDQVRIGATVIEVLIPDQPVVTAPGVSGPLPPVTPGLAPNTIEVEGLVKRFGSHRAVNGIRLFVDPGEVYGFLGPNGAGKSTTVHMLTTLMPPSDGTARIAGFDVVKQGASVRSTIGVALQEAALDGSLNSWEHMDLQMALQGVPRGERRQRRAELIERVGLTYAADRRVAGYSGGMKRRLDLALALAHRPRVLFLDEPTTGLDPPSRTALWEEVVRLISEEGMTVFLTTQYLEEADVLADRVGIIDHGDIVAEGTPAGLKAEIGRPTVEVLPADGAESAAFSEVLARFGELTSSPKRGVAVRLAPHVEGLAEVMRELDARQLAFSNIELHAPTLDDVFLIKTGRSLGGAGTDASADGAEEARGDTVVTEARR